MGSDYFDYQPVSQEDEKLDYAKLTPCPHCKKHIPIDATMCLYCGEEVFYSGKKTWVIWAAVFLLAAFISLVLFY